MSAASGTNSNMVGQKWSISPQPPRLVMAWVRWKKRPSTVLSSDSKR